MTNSDLERRVTMLPITNSNQLVDWHVSVDGETVFVTGDFYDAVARRDYERLRLENDAVKKAEEEAKRRKIRRKWLE